MSDPLLQTTEPVRSTGNVLAAGFGLLVVLGVCAFAFKRPPSNLALEEILGPSLQVATLPPPWQPLALTAITGGTRIALYGDPLDLPPSDEMGPEASLGSMKGGPGSGGGGGRWPGGMSGKFDPNSPWLKVPEGTKGQAPWQWALVRYPKAFAEEKLAKEFGDLKFQDLSQIPESGGNTPIDTGYVEWNGYRLPFVRVRHFRQQDKQPTFHDVVRVNLTRGTEAIVLYARWRPGQLGNIEALGPILECLQPVVAGQP